MNNWFSDWCKEVGALWFLIVGLTAACYLVWKTVVFFFC